MLKRSTLFSTEYEHSNAFGKEGLAKCCKAVPQSVYLEIPTLRTHSLLSKLCTHKKEYSKLYTDCMIN